MSKVTNGRRIPDLSWPLNQRDAHEAAVFMSEPMREKCPESHRRFRNLLAGRLIGAADHDDMMRRLDVFSEDFRKTLPKEPGA